jgi:hypothetical protein
MVIVIAAVIHTKTTDGLQTAKAHRNITVRIDNAATIHLLVPQIICLYLLITKCGGKNAAITVEKDKAAVVHFLVPQIGYLYTS